MNMTLTQILGLVGKLDDTPGEETPRERFRKFLKDNISEVGQIRDYIEECLRNTGEQYNRALQDLVDYIGHFLRFEVTFGRYHGVSSEIGFDGLWKSPTQFFIVIEVKTTEAYAIKTASLMGYVDALISEQIIPDWEHALGLYVVGRPDPEITQLQNAIIAEKRTQNLRIISVEYLLSLAELFNEYDVSHDDILEVLKPSKPTIDPIVGMMAHLVAQRQVQEEPEEEVAKEEEAIERGDLEELRSFVKYLKGRHISIRCDLSNNDSNRLERFISEKKRQGVFILSQGELEDYLPKGCTSTSRLIELTRDTRFKQWLANTTEEPKRKELDSIVFEILGVSEEEKAKVIGMLREEP